MNSCKLCTQKKKLIKAHAIPEAFFRELRIDGEIPLLVSGARKEFPKKSPIGVYDEEILCSECEAKFGNTDDYGIEVFLKKFSELFKPIQQGGKIAGFASSEVNPARLLQFLVSILWRASISSHTFYSKVDLGPHEPLARKSVQSTDFLGVFDAVLSRWSREGDLTPTIAMLDPRREKWQGVNAYRLYLGEVVAYIKVDQMPFPTALQKMSLLSAPLVYVAERILSESKDFVAMKNTAQCSHLNRLRFGSSRRSQGPNPERMTDS